MKALQFNKLIAFILGFKTTLSHIFTPFTCYLYRQQSAPHMYHVSWYGAALQIRCDTETDCNVTSFECTTKALQTKVALSHV